ncbi:hypothetical protein ASF04_26175 [Duganella sp. Leaf61]|nr:hypothetical protein ASF04_26175 [Duganella sp. Leaf61]
MTIDSRRLQKNCAREYFTWVVSDMGLENPLAIQSRFAQDDALLTIKALQAHVQDGYTVESSGSGIVLFRSAGLRAQRKVTTSWWLAPLLQQQKCPEKGEFRMNQGNKGSGHEFHLIEKSR